MVDGTLLLFTSSPVGRLIILFALGSMSICSTVQHKHSGQHFGYLRGLVVVGRWSVVGRNGDNNGGDDGGDDDAGSGAASGDSFMMEITMVATGKFVVGVG